MCIHSRSIHDANDDKRSLSSSAGNYEGDYLPEGTAEHNAYGRERLDSLLETRPSQVSHAKMTRPAFETLTHYSDSPRRFGSGWDVPQRFITAENRYSPEPWKSAWILRETRSRSGESTRVAARRWQRTSRDTISCRASEAVKSKSFSRPAAYFAMARS